MTEKKRRKKGSGPSPEIVRPGGSVGGPSGRSTKPGTMVRAAQEELDAWAAQAAAEGLDRNSWLRTLANAAVRKARQR